MKVRVFVTGSAAFFAAWLAVTFVREVPQENYPRLGKGSLPLSAQADREAVAGDAEPVIEVALAE